MRAPGVRLLTYGDAAFDQLLNAAEVPVVDLVDGAFEFNGRSVRSIHDLDEPAPASAVRASRPSVTIAE